jgi:hypothetical protein
MNELTSTPYVDWEYELITDLGETRLEFLGRTRGDELILAHANPPDDKDAHEWLQEFLSGSIHAIHISIDSYFGQQDDPPYDPYGLLKPDLDAPDNALQNVEHIIFLGEGWATCDGSHVGITLLVEVFRDAAMSALSSLGTDYARTELRIFHLYSLIDPANFSRFLSSLKAMETPLPSVTCLIPPRRKATFEHHELTASEMISVLRRPDGILSYQQLYTHLDVQPRTLRKWLGDVELKDAGQRSLGGCLFTSEEILTTFTPWLQSNVPTEGCKAFIRNLIQQKLI